MGEKSDVVTNGLYCGSACPAWGMWDFDRAWCDVYEKQLSITQGPQGQGSERCSECFRCAQEQWYPKFKKWREAIRKQDDEAKAAGKKPEKYLRKEYRERTSTTPPKRNKG